MTKYQQLMPDPFDSGETTSEAFMARFCHNASMRRSLSGVFISWRSIVTAMLEEIAAIAGNSIFIAYRSPDHGSSFAFRVKQRRKIQLKAGQQGVRWSGLFDVLFRCS
ncbi:MAG: hypothetical protein ACKOHM_07910 [Spartobacteria bacterium]